MQIIIAILLLVIAVLIARIFYYKKERIVKKLKEDSIFLPRHKDPKPEFIDEDSRLLKDIIESIEIENWDVDVKADYGVMDSYEIYITNPGETLQIFGRLYNDNDSYLSVKDFNKNIRIPTFRVAVLSEGRPKSYVNYNNSYINLTLPLLWGYVVEHNNKLNSIAVDKYNKNKSDIDSKLITLKRDRALKKIIN